MMTVEKVKETVDKAIGKIEHWGKLKQYKVYCNPADTETIRQAVGERLKIIATYLVQEGVFYISQPPTTDIVPRDQEPLVGE